MDRDDVSGTERVLTLALSVTAERDREAILRRFVEAAADLTDSQRAIVATVDASGAPEDFFWTGMSDDEVQHVRDTPVPESIFGHFPNSRCLIVNAVSSYAPDAPWLESLPSSENFLAAPIQFGGTTFGRLYLAQKSGGYTRIDGRNCSLLAHALAVALSNSRAYTTISEAAQAQPASSASPAAPVQSRRAARAKARAAQLQKEAAGASAKAAAASDSEPASTPDDAVTVLTDALAAETKARKRSQKEARALKAALKAKEAELSRTQKSLDGLKRELSDANGAADSRADSVAIELRRFADQELRPSTASLVAVQKELSRQPGMSQPVLNRLDATLGFLQESPGKLLSLADQLSSSTDAK